jgi:hypothetical protein
MACASFFIVLLHSLSDKNELLYKANYVKKKEWPTTFGSIHANPDSFFGELLHSGIKAVGSNAEAFGSITLGLSEA